MATHFIDFNAYSLGAVTGWTQTSNNGTASWSIVAGGGSEGNLLQGTNTSSSPSTLTYDGANGDTGRGTCEVTARFWIPTTSAASGFNCGVVGRAQAGSNTGYQSLLRQQATSNVALRRAISTAIASATNATIGTPSTGTWYWVRIQCSGTAIRTRFWLASGGEPGTWDIDTTDASYSDGPLGVLIHNLSGTYQFRFVGIGTNGDSAPLTGSGGTAHHGAFSASAGTSIVTAGTKGLVGAAALSSSVALQTAGLRGAKGAISAAVNIALSATATPAPVVPLTLADLLDDADAQIELIVSGTYLDEAGISHTEWISQTGWDDEIGGSSGIGTIPPLLTTSLNINQRFDPLEPSFSFDTFGDIELSNNHLDYAGRYDPWWQYSVDGQQWIVYAVGYLSDGRRIELSDVIDTPLYRLKGINIPEVGSDTCKIRTRDIDSLDTALQPITYSPPALAFPGTVAGVVDLGNNLNIGGDQSITAWIYLLDTVSTTQYILFKDSGTTGYYLAVGLVGSGTIVGGVEMAVRGQTPALTTTAADVIRPYRWHRIDIAISLTTRRIDIDGVTAITTTGITGTPSASTTSLAIGRSLNGRIHRVVYWSSTRTNETMSAEGRTPITGTETNLREAFMFHEGMGITTVSIKTGSSLTGTLGDGVLWDTASWHYESIQGQYEPFVLGTVPRVPVTWIDPPKQIGQVSSGSIGLISELQSNHTAVSTANYSVNLSNSTLTVTSGALSGTYSATVTANNLWGSALLLNGSTSRATATVTMPAASKYIGAQFRVDNTANINRQIAGWNGATSIFILRMNQIGTNILSIVAVNDAGTTFTASVAVVEGQRYSAVGSLDTANPSAGLKLYLNGQLAATTAISGSWTGTQTTLSIGHRSTAVDLFFPGIIDEIVIGNTACTLSMAEQYHAYPSTSAMPGIIAGWHLDDATGLTAAPFVGIVALTLTATTWTAGRSAITDLARAILYRYGKVESDLDSVSWLTALNDNGADCGWLVVGGAKGIDILNIILGGLGFILYRSGVIIKIKRFEGLSVVANITLDTDTDLQAQVVEPLSSDPAIYLWTLTYATNNSKQDQANIAGGLATTDPDRYQYGAMAYKSVSKSDGEVLERFPDAIPKTRSTALLNRRDAEAEAGRLLDIHRHGADRKSLQMFMSTGRLEILDEIGPLIAETDLDAGNLIVVGVTIDDSSATITIWRPAG